ncbi:MAG: hypothetical protein QOF89_3761 [Acidobacteriota bacterium]|jgi:hypothetical protein|nr:hypothetical protein [Acidobacteriota bacterium]
MRENGITKSMTAPSRGRDEEGAIPLIVRVAGLPAEAVAAFASDLGERVATLRDIETTIVRGREELVAKLYAAVHAAPLAKRRLLLEMKRDSFNGRSLRKYREQPHWANVLEVVGPLAEEVMRFEEQRELWDEAFQVAYAAQCECERRALVDFLDDHHFLRGVAISSALLVENLPRLHQRSPEGSERRVRRLELSLLRYVSRAALKLSPFSSLTRIGLGLVTAEPAAPPELQLVSPETWSERSKVRLERFLIDQLAHVLLRYHPFREGLRVSLNETLERQHTGQFSCIRPGYWDRDSAGSELCYQKPSWVKVRLQGPLIDWLLDHLAGSRRRYSELLGEIQAALPSSTPSDLQSTVDKLLEIGFLCFDWPWESPDLVPEVLLLEYLNTLPTDPQLQLVTDRLCALVSLLNGYAEATQPASVVAEVNRLTREMMRAATDVAEMDIRVAAVEDKDRFFHEDLFVESSLPSAAIASLSPTLAAEAYRSLTPLARLANLFNSRHDVLCSLAGLASHRWPHQDEVAFLDFFQATYPLFQESVRYDIESRPQNPLQPRVFNPLNLPVLEELRNLRDQVCMALPHCIKVTENGNRLQRDVLDDLLDGLPGPYAATRDFCAFLQPLDPRGSQWVLNLFTQGAGRMSSRYTAVMSPEIRARFTSFFMRNSVFEDDEGPAELLDLFWPEGQTVNSHTPQTQRVLLTPGQAVWVEPERLVTPRDLTVRLRGRDSLPFLVDRSGRRILPVHLGALAFRFLPSLAKFLTLFGPGEPRFCAPRRESQHVSDVEVGDRHSIGNVVYARKTWTFDAPSLRSRVTGLSPARAFDAINRWRLDRGIPERVFLAEPIPGTGPTPQKKPQYIDFTSCFLVEIFRSALERTASSLRMSEALPAPDDLPLGERNRRLAVEIQLDSAGFQSAESPPRLRSQTSPPNVGQRKENI